MAGGAADYTGAPRPDYTCRVPRPNAANAPAALSGSGFRLPDLCSARPVLFLCLISVLLALLLVLFAKGLRVFDWVLLGKSAALILCNMLLSAALLCALRGTIAAMPLALGAGAAYAMVLLVCIGLHAIQQWILGTVLAGQPFRVDPAALGRDLLICALLGGAALRYFHLQAELIARERAELDARVRALQARIRPHFLFNSMNIIASLIAAEPEQAERAVEDLSELFRASLREGEATVQLGAELELCDRYLRLEQWRLGERLRVEREIDPRCLEGARIPPLCLQPLLENAVYHGVQQLPEGGCVRLTVHCEDGRLRLGVRNPLPGAGRGGGSGIALANIRDRLAALYGAAASLDLRVEDGHWIAELELPRGGSA
jgi:two-component system sensor histidine kinase AlgZ